jgi:hypothetical protein
MQIGIFPFCDIYTIHAVFNYLIYSLIILYDNSARDYKKFCRAVLNKAARFFLGSGLLSPTPLTWFTSKTLCLGVWFK